MGYCDMIEHILKQELFKVLKEIEIHGLEYQFRRDKLDEYEEATGEEENVILCKGLFHQTKSYISRSVSDATTTQTKGQPLIMMSYANSKNIQKGDKVNVSGNEYRVTGINNINELCIISDVSLEAVLHEN